MGAVSSSFPVEEKQIAQPASSSFGWHGILAVTFCDTFFTHLLLLFDFNQITVCNNWYLPPRQFSLTRYLVHAYICTLRSRAATLSRSGLGGENHVDGLIALDHRSDLR